MGRYTNLFMVARSSDSESEATIIFYGCFFKFFSLATLSHLMDDKMSQKGRGQGPGTEFLYFKPPSVNLERVKLETSNSVHG